MLALLIFNVLQDYFVLKNGPVNFFFMKAKQGHLISCDAILV